MRALAAVLLVALAAPALADGPPEPPPGDRHLVLEAGAPAPVRGLFADEALARYDFERLRWYEASLSACRDVVDQEVSRVRLWPWIGGGAAGLALGVVAGVVLHARWTR